MDFLVEKVHKSRREYVRAGHGRTLDVIYILTNDQSEWLTELKARLKGEGWSTLVTTADLILDAEGIEVGMAVDMEIARKAAVFIGNGVSGI